MNLFQFIKNLDEVLNSSDDEAKRIPNARLGVEVPISQNTSVLGSSQYSGCQGDFCSFDLSFLQSKEIEDNLSDGTQVDMSGLSDFRKGLLFSGSSSKNYISKTSHLGKMISGGSNETNEDGSSLSTRASSAGTIETANKKILFRSIIQARQEMPLVKAQLERHKKGEEGPYMRADNYMDTAVGGKLPSHYYREVPCCLNCYKVYNIIDKARAKAIKALNRERDEQRALKLAATDLSMMTSSHSSLFSGLGNGSITSQQVDQLRSINSAVGSRRGGEEDSVSQETMQVAIAAVDGLTKLDVAEIRSMVKPPAAVEVVMEAVMILLTGKTMPFRDMHRLLSGGEAFLMMLREFDLDQVTDERLALVEPYVDNPLFRPENVSPVSHCASKFCAWVHGIVHAVRYEKGLTHPRIDALRPKRDKDASSVVSIPFSNKSKSTSIYGKPMPRMPAVRGIDATPPEELSFVQKLEKMKAIKQREVPYPISRQTEPTLSSTPLGRGGTAAGSKGMSLRAVSRLDDSSVGGMSGTSTLSRSVSRFDPGPIPLLTQENEDTAARSECKILFHLGRKFNLLLLIS